MPRIRKRFFAECQLMTSGRSLRRSGVTRRTCHATAVGRVQAFPAHHLRAPGQVAIFAEGEEILVEELAFDRDVLDEVAAKERRRAAGAEDILHAIVLAAIDFFRAAIEMPHVAA